MPHGRSGTTTGTCVDTHESSKQSLKGSGAHMQAKTIATSIGLATQASRFDSSCHWHLP
ncbi:hypothetical protein GLOTRDRAFT_100761 [Gloeophyllum trabeum ATCC 11539]|uniref:Uncharacterized protein n=1 Tax=Gloeophyllum trabeum (strain ATCC 11539 / FP-39264 / Madison 617) TaxID=670483 RepID=S7PZ79_GLOTA|nr:uncharacterized protein GLOTRDRAFT_100761 [Gloeophyllum trabeum ATCC 11539]EPQ52956.1 hypothetical protein GLOTRDRAFT_100761 [Gloeophyllum trabeum ATCC 11539]